MCEGDIVVVVAFGDVGIRREVLCLPTQDLGGGAVALWAGSRDIGW